MPVEFEFYKKPAKDVLAHLSTDAKEGLSEQEASSRLKQYGRNVLPSPPAIPGWKRFLAQFSDILTFLLLGATLVSFFAWLLEREHSLPCETIAIAAIVLLNAVLGFLQESRAERAVAALQAMAASQARVLRDGHQRLVAAGDVVPGDILLIEEGDSLPADGRVIESVSMHIAEAALTGESSAVTKDSGALPGDAGLADRSNMIYSGTVVVSGRGRAVVTATGADTEIGKIAGSLALTKEDRTPLQNELNWTGKRLAAGVVIITLVIAMTLILMGGVSTFHDFIQLLLLSVSIAVAAVPEGLTAITTITLSVGMQRMARRNVIVRKLSAVETLGSTTAVCTDKTGTLTKNKMMVRAVITAGGKAVLTGSDYSPEGTATRNGVPVTDAGFLYELRQMLGIATLVNNANLVEREDGGWEVEGDPTEAALVVAAHKVGLTEAGIEAEFPRLGEVPFTSERKMMSTVHTEPGGSGLRVAVKGAPDILLSRCTRELAGQETRVLTGDRRKEILSHVEEMASEALRTIAIGSRSIPESPRDEWNESIEQELVFLGVAGIMDPPRPEAGAAVQAAQAAGARVIMITGDHPVTARAVAAELGIAGAEGGFITGADLEKADSDELRKMSESSSIYARVAPEHKLRIVNALKETGQIVAMTGDGVNDAPALKRADIGVAMGITGTDVSKQAADMILTDDNFASIVAAMEEGRSIFKSIRNALQYLLSSNTGELLTMFLGVVLADMFGLFPERGVSVVVPVLAAQILWINLLTDSAPALALAMEPADPLLMKNPPRDPSRRVITPEMWLSIFLIGALMALGTLLVMDASLPGGLIEGTGTMPHARTTAFTTLVFFQIFNIFNARSPGKSAFAGIFANKWVWAAAALSVLLQVLVVHLPPLQIAFRTTPLSTQDWIVCVLTGSTVLWLNECAKALKAG